MSHQPIQRPVSCLPGHGQPTPLAILFVVVVWRRLQLAASRRPRGPRGLCVDLSLWEALRLLHAALRPHPKAPRRFPAALGSLPRSQRLYTEAMAPARGSEASPRSSEKPPFWGCLGILLGPFRDFLGARWGLCRGLLVPSWRLLGGSGNRFGVSWGRLVASCCPLGAADFGTFPKSSQASSPKTAQENPQTVQERPETPQEMPNGAPREAQCGPRRPQDGTGWAQDDPETASRDPLRSLREARDGRIAPRGPPRALWFSKPPKL